MTGTDVAVADGDFEAVYVTGDGAECRVGLADLGGLRLEDGRPVRSFPSYRGQRNYPGWYWSATMGRRVGFESWVERDHLVALDFDLAVTAVASQLAALDVPAGATAYVCGPASFMADMQHALTALGIDPGPPRWSAAATSAGSEPRTSPLISASPKSPRSSPRSGAFSGSGSPAATRG